ncbi:hypothetical protein TNCV_2911201 [Trichonephila clavipes]|nr:hypothetical protein TNCV_2911201 [Trichonephila clavipes]
MRCNYPDIVLFLISCHRTNHSNSQLQGMSLMPRFQRILSPHLSRVARSDPRGHMKQEVQLADLTVHAPLLRQQDISGGYRMFGILFPSESCQQSPRHWVLSPINFDLGATLDQK